MADKTTTPSRRPRRHGEVITCFALGILVAAIVTIRSTDNDPLLIVGTAAGFILLFFVQYRLELRHHRNQRTAAGDDRPRSGGGDGDRRRLNGQSATVGAPTTR